MKRLIEWATRLYPRTWRERYGEEFRALSQRYPIEDVVQAMRNRHIRITSFRSGIGPGAAFRIEFQYPDALKAQVTTNALMQRMVGQTKVDSVEPITLEVIDPPSPAKNVGSTRRPWITALGVGLGVILGMLVWGVKRWPIVALAGAGGAVVAAALSFLVPNQYISSAVLRADSPDDVNRIVESVLSSQSLSNIILDGYHPLYPQERKKLPIADIVERMRRDVQIRSGRTMGTFQVAFIYPAVMYCKQ